MTKFMISFPSSAMVVPDDEWEAVGEAARAVIREAKAVFGGYTIIEVPTAAEAYEWAAKIAVACRCAQEVREFQYDPES